MRLAGALACALVLAACGAGEPLPPVVVYVPASLEQGLRDRLADSPFDITFVAGDDAALTDQVIDKRDAPRADVLVTSNVYDIWRAAERGALRPLRGSAFGTVPTMLRDPDGSWAAFGYRRLSIVVASGDERETMNLAELGEPALTGKLCLSSSSLPANRTLLGMLIADLGIKPAERLVRSWVRNLARPPLAGHDAVRAALARGDCEYGIVATVVPSPPVRTDPAYVEIDGVGVSRHAQNPEAAQQLVDWMLVAMGPTRAPGISPLNVGQAAWRREDAVRLAERAAYR